MIVPEPTAFDLPKLRVSFGLQNDTSFLSTDDNVAEFFDVKFCPYQPSNQDPVFAAVSKKHVVLCRLSQSSGDANPCEVVRFIRDDDVEASSCCCTWAKHPRTGAPLICIGGVDAKVKIYDVMEGELAECFVGHGGDVNDLTTSPVDPLLIASASSDTTIRLWSLDPIHEGQPCICILGGEGHASSLLSVAFHDTGRFVLSGGHDQTINLWTIPDLPKAPFDSPLQVHYPHFSTSSIHSGIVDCVAFYGDLVLSRACHDNNIVLWKIEGFSSDGPPPPQSIAPAPQAVSINSQGGSLLFARSAFVPTVSTECPAQYTRLLSFYTPNCGPQFFMRFKLHFVAGQNPVLAFCNAGGNVFFWDFCRLTAYQDLLNNIEDPDLDMGTDKSQLPPLPTWLKQVVPRNKAEKSVKAPRHGSDKESTTSAQTFPTEPNVQDTKAKLEQTAKFGPETMDAWTLKYKMHDPYTALRAHKTESSAENMVGRQTAWSPSGEWCVVVGSSNTTLVLQRWAKKTHVSSGTV